MTLEEAAEAVRQRCEEGFPEWEALVELEKRCRALTASARGAERARLDRAAEVIAPCLGAVPRAGAQVALALGVLVEMGASPDLPGPDLIDRVAELLPAAARFVALFEAEASVEEADGTVSIAGRDHPVELVRRIAEGERTGAMVWEDVSRWCLPVIAVATRDTSLRARLRSAPALREAAAALADDGAGFLLELIDGVADEEAVVLHPASQRGFVVRLREVTNGLALYTLLGAALLPLGVPGVASAEVVVDCFRGEGPQRVPGVVLGPFQLHTWLAWRGFLDPSHQHWVWGEGLLSEIPRWGGQLVLLVSDSTIRRSSSAQRTFCELRSDVLVERELVAAEVVGWLDRIARDR